nr:MAG TPA: hypothetical protein [Caudoviricetes sp.]
MIYENVYYFLVRFCFKTQMSPPGQLWLYKLATSSGDWKSEA